VAIDHARRYSGLASRQDEVRRTVDALDATVEIARALGGDTDLGVIFGLIANRGRALVSARTVVIEHKHKGEMLIAAGAGELPEGLLGQRVDVRDSVAGAALRTGTTLRLEDVPSRARFARRGLGCLGVRAEAGLVVPLLFQGRGHGVLVAVDRLQDGPAFNTEDQRLLEAFAVSAAAAAANAETVERERRRQRLAVAEQERACWARELHDETFQSLAALRLGLVSHLEGADPESMTEPIRRAVAQLETDLGSLGSLIADLRAVTLDELGIDAAIEDLAERARSHGVEVSLGVELAYEQGRAPGRHKSELETTIYRIVQEALTNTQRHSGAPHAWVNIEGDQAAVRITVRDDGSGFDTTATNGGRGLLGMHERVELLDGTLHIQSAPGHGTTLRSEQNSRPRGPARLAERAGSDRPRSATSAAPRSQAGRR
jgi:signal transduction histidine kinase